MLFMKKAPESDIFKLVWFKMTFLKNQHINYHKLAVMITFLNCYLF